MTTRTLERRLGDAMRARLPRGAAEFVMFVLKQGWASLFGGLILIGLILSSRVWQPDWALARYDFLLIYAIALQAAFLALKLESWREVRVIFLFHLTGTAMELFKVNVGSWSYPEPAVMKFWGVPLFSGFMYASVGSYMARVIRVFDMRFAPFPPFWLTGVLAIAIYVNFFAHHYLPDARMVLFAATVVLYLRTRIWFRIGDNSYWMPLPLAAFLSSVFLWLAENVGTNTRTWLYAGQSPLEWVSLAKMGSWYLLLYVSFATVLIVFREALSPQPFTAGSYSGTTRPAEQPVTIRLTAIDPSMPRIMPLRRSAGSTAFSAVSALSMARKVAASSICRRSFGCVASAAACPTFCRSRRADFGRRRPAFFAARVRSCDLTPSFCRSSSCNLSTLRSISASCILSLRSGPVHPRPVCEPGSSHWKPVS